MTRTEYEAYEAAVAAFLEREGIDGFCQTDETGPFFSWKRCECCDRPLGGDRYTVSAYCNGTLEHYSVCPNCVYYAAYGRLDDMTMANLVDM